MQAAPLWDPTSCQFVGLLTVTDFIDVLRHYRRTGADVSTLATRSIAEILSDSSILTTVLQKHTPQRGHHHHQQQQQQQLNLNPNSSNTKSSSDPKNNTTTIFNHHHTFLSADANTTLKHACRLLHNNSLDFLPIILPEDMRVLATITYTTILEHLVTHFREQRRLFDDTVYDLGIGTYDEHVITVSLHQTLNDVLHTLHIHGLSAVPVVDDYRKIRAVYSRSDITFLATAKDAADAVANLDMTLEELIQKQRLDVTTPDALHTCTTSHTLQSIFEYFAQWKFNRLIVVDEEERVTGIVSARDLVAYFLEGS
jgi:CBS domain-containing protein